MKISLEQFERALDVAAAYEPGRGISIHDLVGAIGLAFGAKLPETVISKNAVRLLAEVGWEHPAPESVIPAIFWPTPAPQSLFAKMSKRL